MPPFKKLELKAARCGGWTPPARGIEHTHGRLAARTTVAAYYYCCIDRCLFKLALSKITSPTNGVTSLCVQEVAPCKSMSGLPQCLPGIRCTHDHHPSWAGWHTWYMSRHDGAKLQLKCRLQARLHACNAVMVD